MPSGAKNWKRPRLGPAVAKQKLGDLFEGNAYDSIRKTSPETAFQVFLVDANLWDCQKDLAQEKVYVRNLKSYGYFATFSLGILALDAAGARWGHPELTKTFSEQWEQWDTKYYRLWRNFTKACIDQVVAAFEKESRKFARKEGEKLTFANYFKNQKSISQLLESGLSGDIKRLGRAAVKA